MQRYPVNSSRIANVGWDADTLEVQFHNGAIYQYHNVSEQEYHAFMNSPSLGSALSKLDKVHPYNKV